MEKRRLGNRRAALIIFLAQDAVLRDEGAADLEGLAAGPGEADDVPVIDDLDVLLRHQHRDGLLFLAALHIAGRHYPICMVDAAGERMPAGPLHAAVHYLALAE